MRLPDGEETALNAVTPHGLDQIHIDRVETMLRIRRIEEEILRLFELGLVPGFPTQSIGQEATAVGAVSALNPSDVVFSNHRNRGHLLSRGSSLEAVLAEVRCLAAGTLGGRGGAMHVADPSVGVPYTSAIVGGGLGLAAGWALSNKLARGGTEIAVAFFGDGVAEEGVFAETLNFAALWKLPLLMICENNGMESGGTRALEYPVSDLAAGAPADVATVYKIPTEIIDGSDLQAVYDASQRAVEHIRNNEGPYFIEARTVRWPGNKLLVPQLTTGPLGISMAWDDSAIPDDHRDWFANIDPILNYVRALDINDPDLRTYLIELDSRISTEVREASQRLDHSSEPDPSTAYEYI